MASLLDALATSAKDRVASTAKDAKENAMQQFDPRKSIYNLGLGVGPLIRQTVAEYKKQQGQGNDKDNKKTAKDIVDIKSMTSSSKNSLSRIDAQFRAMNGILGDIRKINMAQLQALKVGASFKETTFSKGTEFKSFTQDRETSKDSDGSVDKFGIAKKVALGAGLFAGAGVAYNNKDAIEKVLDDYLKGAGLPTKEELGKVLGDRTKELPGKVADLIGDTLVDGVLNLSRAMGEALVRRAKRDWDEATGNAKDKQGNPMPADNTRLGKDVGTIGGGIIGAILGSKIPGMKLLGGALGAYAGNTLGEANPEATIGGLGALAAGGLAWKLRSTKAAQAAQAATTARATPVPPSMPTQPWQVPSGAPASNVRMSPGGIIIPEAPGARSAESAKSIADAANKTLTVADKAGVAARNTISSLAKYGREATSIVSKYGRGMVGLSALFALPDIYEDIKDGDYEAAAVRTATLIGSTAIGLTGFFSAGAGFVAGTGLSIGGNYAANALKKPKVTPSQSPSNTNPQSNATSNVSPNETPTGVQSGGDLPSWVPDRIRNDPVFIKELNRVAASLGVDPIDLLAVMKAESGIYANIQNGGKPGDPFVPGKATGLIQFMPDTAKDLGTTTDALYGMNETAQLKYVEQYFKKSRLPRGATSGEIYGHVFAPAATRSREMIMYKNGTKEYEQNASLDYGNKGYITREDLSTRIALSVGARTPNSEMAAFHATEGNNAQLRGMGVTDDQISSITAAQRNIRQMTDMANILPDLLSGGPGFAGRLSPNASNNGSAGGNKPVDRSDPSSTEKDILMNRLKRG